MSESHFGRRLREKLEPFGFRFFRIETHATAPGCPDIHWVHFSGLTGWIEVKQMQQERLRVDYRPYQALWLETYRKSGGRACTLIHVRAPDDIIFVPAEDSRMAEKDLPSAHTARFSVQGTDGWRRIARLLLA